MTAGRVTFSVETGAWAVISLEGSDSLEGAVRIRLRSGPSTMAVDIDYAGAEALARGILRHIEMGRDA